MPEVTPSSPPGPPFTSTLEQIQDGVFVRDIEDECRSLVATMRRVAQATGGKPSGKLTIELSFKLDGGIFEVAGDVRVKSPKVLRSRSIFYATNDSRLTPDNPKQLELGVTARDVNADMFTGPRSVSR